MRISRPMVEHKFDNEYHVIVFALSSLLDRFEKEDWLFAAQCIWWQASIIQFMEILIYYGHHKLFPSDVIKNCVDTQLLQTAFEEICIPEFDIPLIDINHGLDIEGYSSGVKRLPEHRTSKRSSTTRLRRVSKNHREPTNPQLQARFGSLTEYQNKWMWELLKSGKLKIGGRLHLDIILLIVSECQIYLGTRSRRILWTYMTIEIALSTGKILPAEILLNHRD